MEGLILTKTREIFSKAIKRIAEKDQVEADNVSVLLKLVDEELKYMVCHNHVPIREIVIKEILGYKKVDMSGFSVLIPPQIKNILLKQQILLGSKDIEVCIYLDRKVEDRDEVMYFVYKDGNLLHKAELLDLIK